jgi:hypothetical protein
VRRRLLVEERVLITREARCSRACEAFAFSTIRFVLRARLAAPRVRRGAENVRDRTVAYERESDAMTLAMTIESGTSQTGLGASWREADHALRQIAARRAALDADEARWLLIARAAQVHVAYGFGSFVEYCERVLGYRPHTTRERLRVAEALIALPETSAALAEGALSYSAVRELTRVVTPETETAWLDAARDRTIGEIERMVVGRDLGDLPDDPQDPDLEPCILRLALTPDVYALFLAVRRKLKEDTGESLDDNDVMASLCEAVLSPGESERAPYQLAFSTCPTCMRTTQDAAGQVIDVPPGTLELAGCDHDHLGDLDDHERLASKIPPSTRRTVIRRDHARCRVPGCRHARFLQLHHIRYREHGGSHLAENLILLCGAHHRAVHRGTIQIDGTSGDLRIARSRPGHASRPPP